MKGILLAEDPSHPLLYPLANRFPRQLLPVYDKPLIYYSLSNFMLAGIREILIRGENRNLACIQDCLGDGHQWGLQLQYAPSSQSGLTGALLESKAFIGHKPVAISRAEIILHGKDLVDLLRSFAELSGGAAVFAYSVRDPQSHTIIEVDAEDRPLSLEDQPALPKSRYSVPDLYFYDHTALDLLEELRCGEDRLPGITALNRQYMRQGKLRVVILGRGIAWLDAGTAESLLQSANFIQVVQERQGFMISCPEEIAFRSGFIDEAQLMRLADTAGKTPYGEYLRRIPQDTW